MKKEEEEEEESTMYYVIIYRHEKTKGASSSLRSHNPSVKKNTRGENTIKKSNLIGNSNLGSTL